MLTVTQESFDQYSVWSNSIKKAFYYGINIGKRHGFDDNSCRDLMINLLPTEYPNLVYRERFNEDGYIILKKAIACDNDSLSDFTLTMTLWLTLCKESEVMFEQFIRRFMPNKVGNLPVMVYCL